MTLQIGLVPHRDKPAAHALARQAAAWLDRHDVPVRIPALDADRVGLGHLGVGPESLAEVDVVVSIGGDGTMLHAVDLVRESSSAAVLGVNAGQLGYLTEVEPGAMVASLERLVARDFTVLERMMLAITVESAGPAAGKWPALNELVIEKTDPGHTVRLEVSINGTPFTTYVADGVIVSTPTGSTAYSFSAGGPIVSPRHECLLLTPVAAHMLFNRALVFAPDEELRFVAGDRSAVLSTDGRKLGRLEAGDVVHTTSGSSPARIVTFGARDFHQILKAKFGLADR